MIARIRELWLVDIITIYFDKFNENIVKTSNNLSFIFRICLKSEIWVDESFVSFRNMSQKCRDVSSLLVDCCRRWRPQNCRPHCKINRFSLYDLAAYRTFLNKRLQNECRSTHVDMCNKLVYSIETFLLLLFLHFCRSKFFMFCYNWIRIFIKLFQSCVDYTRNMAPL